MSDVTKMQLGVTRTCNSQNSELLYSCSHGNQFLEPVSESRINKMQALLIDSFSYSIHQNYEVLWPHIEFLSELLVNFPMSVP